MILRAVDDFDDRERLDLGLIRGTGSSSDSETSAGAGMVKTCLLALALALMFLALVCVSRTSESVASTDWRRVVPVLSA